VLIALARSVFNPNSFTLQARYQGEIVGSVLRPCSQGVKFAAMDKALIKRVRSELARLGGEARAKKLGAKRRKEIAIRASKAAAKARSQRAKERRAQDARVDRSLPQLCGRLPTHVAKIESSQPACNAGEEKLFVDKPFLSELPVRTPVHSVGFSGEWVSQTGGTT
jgi:hypothetical protein